MSSKRKSQPTRIRDQHQEKELQVSPLPSPEMDTEKGLYICFYRQTYIYIYFVLDGIQIAIVLI